MKAIIDGKFNPKCVTFDSKRGVCFTLNEYEWCMARSKENEQRFRDDLKLFLEVVLGRNLEDYVEPWRYYLDRTHYERAGSHIYVWRFRNGEGFFRWLDDPQRGWCPTTVNAEQGIQSWPVTEDEAAKMLGRSLL